MNKIIGGRHKNHSSTIFGNLIINKFYETQTQAETRYIERSIVYTIQCARFTFI